MSPSDSGTAFSRMRLEPVSLSPEDEHVIGARLLVRPWERAAQIGDASWWIDLFGSLTSNDPLGVIYWFPEAVPVVCASACEAALVASSPRTLIPMALFRTGLDAGASSWEERRDAWPSVREAALSAHRALGGKDELAGLEQVLFDDRLKVACDQGRGGDYHAAQAARAEILLRLDPDPNQMAYRLFVQSLLEAGFRWPPDEDLGPWRGSAANAAFSTIGPDIEDRSDVIDCAWEMLMWPAGFGLCHPGEPVHVDLPAGGEAVRLLERAASLITRQHERLSESRRDDPRLAAIMALAKQDRIGIWKEFARSAEAFEAAGHWRKAWTSLLSATFWHWQAHERGDLELFEAGHEISRHAGWQTITLSLKEIESCFKDAQR